MHRWDTIPTRLGAGLWPQQWHVANIIFRSQRLTYAADSLKQAVAEGTPHLHRP